MQIVVYGMHRSGTSVLGRLLNILGLYFGSEGSSIEPAKDNTKGFWERRDILDLNNNLLRQNDLEWFKVSNLVSNEFSFNSQSILDFQSSFGKVIHQMDSFRPWFIKDPRFCLYPEIVQKHLELPGAIIMYRDPMEVALSLRKRNGFPLEFSFLLWNLYYGQLANLPKDVPLFFQSYEHLLKDPVKSAKDILNFLNKSFGYEHKVRSNEILAAIDETMYHEHGESTGLPSSSKSIFKTLRDGAIPERTIWSSGDIEKLRNYEQIFDRVYKFNRNSKLTDEIHELKKELMAINSAKTTISEELSIKSQEVIALKGINDNQRASLEKQGLIIIESQNRAVEAETKKRLVEKHMAQTKKRNDRLRLDIEILNQQVQQMRLSNRIKAVLKYPFKITIRIVKTIAYSIRRRKNSMVTEQAVKKINELGK